MTDLGNDVFESVIRIVGFPLPVAGDEARTRRLGKKELPIVRQMEHAVDILGGVPHPMSEAPEMPDPSSAGRSGAAEGA